jgi:hypothetical protein
MRWWRAELNQSTVLTLFLPLPSSDVGEIPFPCLYPLPGRKELPARVSHKVGIGSGRLTPTCQRPNGQLDQSNHPRASCKKLIAESCGALCLSSRLAPPNLPLPPFSIPGFFCAVLPHRFAVSTGVRLHSHPQQTPKPTHFTHDSDPGHDSRTNSLSIASVSAITVLLLRARSPR